MLMKLVIYIYFNTSFSMDIPVSEITSMMETQ